MSHWKISISNFVCVIEYIFQRSKYWLIFFFMNMYLKWHLCLRFSCCIMKDFIDCSSSFCGYYSGTFCCYDTKFKIILPSLKLLFSTNLTEIKLFKISPDWLPTNNHWSRECYPQPDRNRIMQNITRMITNR